MLALSEDTLIKAQHFANGPRLKRTTSGSVRRFGVGNFRNVTHAGFIKMTEEWREKLFAGFASRFGGVPMDAHPGLHKWSDQPGPDGALMIRTVALHDPAFIMRCISGFARCERTQ